MHKLLERQAVKYGGRTFIYFEDKKYSFEEVNDAASRVACGLEKLGIVKGDKVAVVMENCPEGYKTLWLHLLHCHRGNSTYIAIG
jgi:acyl-CoA synthetase (AMP-forming)/AMP-acid ligase II